MSLLQTIQKLRPNKKCKVQPDSARHHTPPGHSKDSKENADPQDASTPHIQTGKIAGCPAAERSLGASAYDRQPEATAEHSTSGRSKPADAQGSANLPDAGCQAQPAAKGNLAASSFYTGSHARSSAVDRKIEAYLRGAQQILRSKDAAYVIKSFPLQEPAFQFADEHAASSQLK